MNLYNGVERRIHNRITSPVRNGISNGTSELYIEYKVVYPKEDSFESYDRFYNARVENISIGGVFIITKNRIKKYALLEVKLLLEKKNILTKAKVIRIEEAADRNYRIGIKFLSLSNANQEVIKKFIDFSNNV